VAKKSTSQLTAQIDEFGTQWCLKSAVAVATLIYTSRTWIACSKDTLTGLITTIAKSLTVTCFKKKTDNISSEHASDSNGADLLRRQFSPS
jgi:protoporphyrinogen oxidase